eukprot:m.42850 g.42850  ORF g.42850 m.42850 type:complete len:92 (-) comp10741_c0_seq3:3887-4162(-)
MCKWYRAGAKGYFEDKATELSQQTTLNDLNTLVSETLAGVVHLTYNVWSCFLLLFSYFLVAKFFLPHSRSPCESCNPSALLITSNAVSSRL